MTNGFSPGPWLSERKSVRKLAQLELIPVDSEFMRTQWQEPSPWLRCDSRVQRTMAISRLGTPPRSSPRAWAKRRRGGGA